MSDPKYFFDPREYFKDELDARDMTLADCSDCLRDWYDNENAPLTERVSDEISKLFGAGDELWLNLEAAWQSRPVPPLKRLDRIIRNAEELIADIEWWNANRTDAAPFDCECDRLLLESAKQARAAMLAGDNEATEKHMADIQRHGEASLG